MQYKTTYHSAFLETAIGNHNYNIIFIYVFIVAGHPPSQESAATFHFDFSRRRVFCFIGDFNYSLLAIGDISLFIGDFSWVIGDFYRLGLYIRVFFIQKPNIKNYTSKGVSPSLRSGNPIFVG